MSLSHMRRWSVCAGSGFLFYPEVIARGNEAAETMPVSGLLSAGALWVLPGAPAEAKGTEPGGTGLALDVRDAGVEGAAR